MPDAITHILFAKKVLKDSGINVDIDSFYIGAMGPDPLFYYNLLSFCSSNDIPSIASKIHHLPGHIPISHGFEYLSNQTDVTAKTIQRSWMTGFVSHYILDSSAHPYINTISKGYINGHKRFEMKIDTLLLKMLEDRRSDKFDFKKCLYTDKTKLKLISKLFSNIVQQVLDQPFESDVYIKSLGHMIRICSLFKDQTKVLKPLSKAAQKLLNKKDAFEYLFYTDPKPSEPDYLNLSGHLYEKSFLEIFFEAAEVCVEAFKAPEKTCLYSLDFSGEPVV